MASVSDDFDLDTFLELQSSDEDESDVPMLDRTLEEILNESDDESSSSDGSLKDNRLLFRNPNFKQQQYENRENKTGAEETTEEGREGTSYECSASILNVNNEFDKTSEKRDRETEILDSSRLQVAKSKELKLGLNLKTFAFSELGSKASPFVAPSPPSSLLSRSPALYPKLGSVKPNPKPGAALAAAAAASRSILGPHATAIKNRMANAIQPQKSQDSEDLVDSSKKIAEHVEEEEEEKESEENEIVSDAGVAEGVFALHENSSYSELNLVRSDDEMDRRRNVVTDKDDESLSLSEHEEFMIQDEKPKAECVEDKIMSENDKDDGTEQCKTDTGLEAHDRNVQAIEYEPCSPLANSALDTSIETQIPKSSGTSITPLANSRSKTSPGTQRPISGSVSMDDDDHVSDANTEEHTYSSNLFTEPAKTSVEQMKDKVIENISEDKKAKAGDENVVKAESSRVVRKIGKRASASLKPLDLAEELEKRDASSGLHWEEGVAAQPMRLEGIRRGPPAIGHLQIDSTSSLSQALASQMYKRDHGSPQAIAVHHNYIAVGMSKGSVLVNTSKYSAQNPDIIDSKVFILGSSVEKSQPPVTSMCFNQQGELLLVGYGNGSLMLWELQRATVAKVITGEHSSPIVHTLFLGQDLQNPRQFKAITGDSKGIVLLHTFAVVPLLRRFSVTTQCLFDGQRTGTVLSMSALLFDESQMSASNAGQSSPSLAPGSLGSMMGGVVGGVVGGDAGKRLFSDGPSAEESGGVVIFVTQQTALVVRLIPSVEVYAKLSRPDGIREGAMPYTAWRRISNQHGSSGRKSNSNSTSNGSADSETSGLSTMQEVSVSTGSHDTEEMNDKASLLAVVWDRKVQVAQLLKSDLKVLREWNLDSAALGVAWLDEQILVILNSKGQLCLFTKEGMELDRNRLPIEGGGLDSAVIYHTHFVNSFGNPEKAYHNSIAVRGAAIYLLGPMQLFRSRLLPWKERIQALQDAGDWMSALLMAMELYDGNAQGVIGLPRSLDAMREAIMPFLLQLLSAYVDEAFSYISLAFSNQNGKLETAFEGKTPTGSIYPQIKEQFARVGGVAIEFCVHIKRTDVLFDSVFSKFVGAQHGGIFLELLEPYILKDMLGGLPPEIMHALVEHYSRKGWLQRIEQCVLHMDIASLDFNQVVRLCREHGLYSALIYLFNRGLDDFKAPLEELLAVAQDQKRPNSQAFGYKMLVYLKYCFLGLAFPPGHGNLPPERLAPLRTELLLFLLERTSIGRSQFKLSPEFSSQPYPNLCYLLWLDTEATLEVFRCAFIEDEYLHTNASDIPSLYLSGYDSENQKLNESFHETPSNVMDSDNVCNLLQTLVNALTQILDMSFSGTLRVSNAERHNNKGRDKFWPSRKEIGSLLEFIAYFVACRRATVSRGMLNHIIEYLASKTDFVTGDISDNSNEDSSRKREKLMFALLKGVPESQWDPLYVLELAQNAQFHQVCSLVYMLKGQYIAALDSYIKDVGQPMYAFAFISNLLRQWADVNASNFAEFRSAVLKRIPDLVQLNREATFLLVLEHFDEQNQQIISELRQHPKCLFLYLKTIIDVHSHGIPKYSSMLLESNSKISVLRMKELDQSKELQDYLNRISNLPEHIQRHDIEVTDEMAELYLELLCQFEPKSVLKFLESFENYRLEHCLRLCQKYGVTDAAAFLLERVGDVGSALSLIISDVNMRIQDMDSAMASMYGRSSCSVAYDDKQLNVLLMMPEVDAVHAILVAAVSLCQRNTLRLDPQESESLWFRLLDTFSEPTRDLYKHEKSLLDEKGSRKKSQKEELTLKPLLRWKVINVGKAAFLRKIFAHFIGEIIEGMMGYVPLPTIMSKLLSDNGNQEFGDFKATILGLLGIYGYERTILDTAKNLIEDDAYYNINMLKKGASHAYVPASSYCCICGRALDKDSFGSSIYIFQCGHAAHLQCETQDTVASTKDSIRGCPVCLPNKRRSVKKKMIESRKEIVREASSSVQNQAVSSKPMHENAMIERPYGLHYQSRFELLNNLQKGQKSLEVGLLPNLRLAPPTVYHEHKARNNSLNSKEETSNGKLKKPLVILAHRPKSSSPFQFPLTSSFFGNEKNRKR